MKTYLYVLIFVVFAQGAQADCQSTSPLVGKFRLLEKTEPTIKCDTGRLKVVGCVLKIYMVNSERRQTEISVYGNPEICDWKANETREMTIGQECCDIRYRVNCKDGKNGMYSDEETDQKLACMTETRLYVEKYKRKEKGKSVQRIYNQDKRAFENVPKNKP